MKIEGTLGALLQILLIALVLIVIFFIVKMFVGGQILTIIGAILALVFLILALRALGVMKGGDL